MNMYDYLAGHYCEPADFEAFTTCECCDNEIGYNENYFDVEGTPYCPDCFYDNFRKGSDQDCVCCVCGETIEAGYEYIDIDGEAYHEDCAEDIFRTQERC